MGRYMYMLFLLNGLWNWTFWWW